MNRCQYDLLRFFKTYAPFISKTQKELVVEDDDTSFISEREDVKYFIFGKEVRDLFADMDFGEEQVLIDDLLKKELIYQNEEE